MYSIQADVYLTRRQRLHFILDGDDNLVWSGKSFAHAVEFLVSADQTEFTLDGLDGESSFRLIIRADWTNDPPPA